MMIDIKCPKCGDTDEYIVSRTNPGEPILCTFCGQELEAELKGRVYRTARHGSWQVFDSPADKMGRA